MEFRKLKAFDWKLLAIICAIFCIGMVALSSATHSNIEGFNRQLKIQGASFIIGMLIMAVMLLFDYNSFAKYQKQIYIANILLLLIVYLPGLGIARAGARSWINLGFIDLQTSELVKIGFILSFAKFLEDKKGRINNFKDLLPIAAYAAPIVLLILKQPDLGTAIVFMSIIFGMLFVCDINLKMVAKIAAAGLLSIPAIYPFLEAHQKVRIDAFIHPGDPSFEGNYQVIQSMIAIGSGKIFGKGLFKGTQNQYDFLPVQDSDFIFAVLGEEFGFIGACLLVVLFYFFLKGIISISRNSKDFYGTLVSTGVLFMFLYQIVQNIGMTMGLMPVTGVTLPLVSYGGSSMVTSLMALGLVFNVSMRRKKINF
ncbi:MAG: rod shape-determining protein RodA [Peptoclostridium sp.]|uniref:rod shape-determining protein RodA n=1 Tax=Peptoclostridium sp. TaxID=1904860 RepID=UPI00139BABEB|nr:rod shape-determining protein RodA [Peptoclostridium sp.]MZQ76022.1 rod shape-determining protein RodA [Peptoclostridium sp.]